VKEARQREQQRAEADRLKETQDALRTETSMRSSRFGGRSLLTNSGIGFRSLLGG